MDWLLHDLRLALRLLGKDKAFSMTSALTLAVCIGANTALFAVVHSVLLRPLPVPDAGRIVLMGNTYFASCPSSTSRPWSTGLILPSSIGARPPCFR